MKYELILTEDDIDTLHQMEENYEDLLELIESDSSTINYVYKKGILIKFKKMLKQLLLTY